MLLRSIRGQIEEAVDELREEWRKMLHDKTGPNFQEELRQISKQELGRLQ